MRRIPTLAVVERRHILNTLYLYGNNRTHAAKALGLSLRCLRIKLRQYEDEGFRLRPVRAPAKGRLLAQCAPHRSAQGKALLAREEEEKETANAAVS